MEIPISWILLVGGLGAAYANYKVLPNESAMLSIVALVAIFGGLGGITGVVDYAAIGGSNSGDGGNGDRPNDDRRLITVKAMDNISITTRTKGANSYTAYTGKIKLWHPDVNPGDANANAVSTSTVAAGVGTINARSFKTGDELKLTLDGESTWYDMVIPTGGDFVVVDSTEGIIKFTTADTTEESVSPEVEFLEIVTIATIDDMFEEDTTGGNLNGQTTCVNGSVGTNEVAVGDDSDACEDGDVLLYDESVGNGDWYYKIDIGVTGANKYGEEMALCYEWESGAEPEGNEFSSIYASKVSGTDLGIPNELVNYFSSEACVQLGTISGGQTGQYKFLYAVTEANLDTNDDFKLTLDDNGGIALKDIHLGAKASNVNIDHDAQA